MSKNGASPNGAKPKAKKGRPTGYQPLVHPTLAREYAYTGATNAGIAGALGIGLSTLYEWKAAFPEFSDALRAGKAPADGAVASALFQRAIGCEWQEEVPVKLRSVWYVDGHRHEEERVELVLVTKRTPPDTAACLGWLRNRIPDVWREVTHHRHDVLHRIGAMTPQELKAAGELDDEALIRFLEEGEPPMGLLGDGS